MTDKDDENISPDAIRAALQHTSLLRHFHETGVETALILEDDVDFGLDLKAQLESLSQTFWSQDELLLESGLRIRIERTRGTFCGLGTVGWSSSPARASRSPGREQQLVHGVAPTGSYAYAINRQRAASLIEENHSRTGQNWDYTLHRDCKGLVQRCTAPVPELMHHHKVVGEQTIDRAGDAAVQDMDWYRARHKYTYNVEWSARCNAAHTGEDLEDRRQCLPGLYDSIV